MGGFVPPIGGTLGGGALVGGGQQPDWGGLARDSRQVLPTLKNVPILKISVYKLNRKKNFNLGLVRTSLSDYFIRTLSLQQP